MRLIVFTLAAALSLNACEKPVDQEPSAQELDTFVNKLEADAERDRSFAVSEARAEEAKRAVAAERRLKNSVDQRQKAQ